MEGVKRYRGIIFDLDGVICATDEYHYLAWKAVTDRLGIPFERQRNHLLRGLSRMDCLEIVLEKSGKSYSEQEKRAIAEEKNSRYLAYVAGMTPDHVSADVQNTLRALRRRKIPLAIGSSSKNTPLILERLGLGRFFDAVADGNIVEKSKPDPEVFLKAAEMLKLPPSDCLVVDDGHAGVAAAAAGGFDCAAIGSAKEDPGALWHLELLSDLLRIPGIADTPQRLRGEGNVRGLCGP